MSLGLFIRAEQNRSKYNGFTSTEMHAFDIENFMIFSIKSTKLKQYKTVSK